ncbi:MAG TPA: hypothetical protein V6C58_00675 [Allocoleopsis sp.]
MIYLDKNALKAAVGCVGKKDVRLYLQYVLIDVQEKFIHIVSSDGYMLFQFRQLNSDRHQIGKFLLNPSDIKTALKTVPKQTEIIELDTQNKILGNLKVNFADENYPDWKRVIPNVEYSLTPKCVVNPDLAAKCAEAVSTATKRNFVIQSHSESKVIFHTMDTNCFALLMSTEVDEQQRPFSIENYLE